MKYLWIIMPAAILLLIMIFFSVFKLRKNRRMDRLYSILTAEELEMSAERAALTHTVTVKQNSLNWPMAQANDNYEFIKLVYNALNEDMGKKRAVPHAAEWILDNYYVIEEQIKSIRKGLTKKDYHNLPILNKGAFKGCTRALAIAVEYISIVDGQVDESTLHKYLDAYQKHSILYNREIRILPMMIQITLLENIRSICEYIKETQHQWKLADDIIEKEWLSNGMDVEKITLAFGSVIEGRVDESSSFIEHLFYRLRHSGRSYVDVLQFINGLLVQFSTTTESIAQKEHNAQAVSSVSMGNYVSSFKYIASLDWTDIFEALSYVEKILKNDPSDIYIQMTSQTKGYYLMRIEQLAKEYSVSERHIAEIAVQLAQSASDSGEDASRGRNHHLRRSHVGYYLMGDGVQILEKIQSNKDKVSKKMVRMAVRYQGPIYIGMILLVTSLFIGETVRYSVQHALSYPWVYGIIAGIAMLIPASEIGVSFINWISGKVKKPSFFPSLELKDGIPQSLSSMVVVPTLLSDENRVVELLRNLENHYLANKEQHLYFALIGGFKDSDCASSLVENPILQKAVEGILSLNQQYATGERNIFYFFHRNNIFNENEQRWTGWERKRGALMEFNDLLYGAKDTSFIREVEDQFLDIKLKYIITLDADTQLPLGMAKKMIGTMAHPYNLPVIDDNKKVVVEGHGLMQPRILFDMESSNKSYFSRIYTGQQGSDPYANAISDVYQDLFDEGIFTGKGIYDLKVFREILQDVVPENAVLSHDLLEGSYVRAALASNLELVDSYPAKYNAYMARLHRWVRGDWQLIPWLKRRIYNRNKEIVKNPLSYISIWKIGDNLRRSLLSPALIFLIVLGICILPGSVFYWLGAAFGVIMLPLFIYIFEAIVRNTLNMRADRMYAMGFYSFKTSVLQLVLTTIFLPYQAIVVLHGIVVTLARVLITKRKLLEWVTSDDIEKTQNGSLASYIAAMASSTSIGVAIGAYSFLFRPDRLLVSALFIAIWGVAPFIAYFISQEIDDSTEVLSKEERDDLRQVARKTWRYFEEFANKKNNYIAPDNYQEEPYRGIACRSSPTNIGLGLMATLTARDLGYIGSESLVMQLERTMDTISKLKKWNGHLYNWYDTRTLEPLKPHYISTVDSGNLVCYLMTLRQGLKEYFERPLIEDSLIYGIEDTYACGNGNEKTFFEPYDIRQIMISDKILSMKGWKKALEKAISNPKEKEVKKEAWQYKLEHMIQEHLKELRNYAPWIDIIESVPSGLYENQLKFMGINWVELLDTPPSLMNYDNHCEEIRQMGNRILEILEFFPDNPDTPPETMNRWVIEILSKVELGQEKMRALIVRYQLLCDTIHKTTEDSQFIHLYDPKRQLFSIGFNLVDNKLSNSYYDLLASEARQTSYIAIARGEVEPKHWAMLGRSLTVVDRHKGLVSWSGTMFEYLMPLILMKNYKNTLLDETYEFVIKSQKKYGKERKMPWGSSESGFSSMDIHLDYQYKAIGIPWLGLKRGLIEDAVTTPYATFLALMVSPLDAYKNIQYLRREGIEGNYGFYEAADYTSERLRPGQDKTIVKSYMAHHQGMSLLAMNNYFNRNILQRRFSSDPYVDAARLLLQEKVPQNIIFTKESKEKIMPVNGLVFHVLGPKRQYVEPDASLPKVHVLSNGYYSVMVTDKGTGYSRTSSYGISRWREDAVEDTHGMFFYIKNKNTGDVWSAAYAPFNTLPKGYEVIFTADKALLKRRDGFIETRTEIIVTSGENAEIRRIELQNNGEKSCELEVLSYFEVVIAEQKSDEAHPAFSNLFVETEFNQEYKALLAHRRPRSDTEKDVWVAQMAIADGGVVGDIQYETDRMQFIGRGRTVLNPLAIERERPLSNSAGNVLDPIFSLKIKVSVLPTKTARISFVTLTAYSKENLMELVSKYNSVENCDAAFWLAVIRTQIEMKYLNMKVKALELYQNLISDILFLSPLRQQQGRDIRENRKGQSGLWQYGISGDYPVVLVKIHTIQETEILYELLKAHEYWCLKDLRVDLVVLVTEEYNYLNPVFEMVSDIVATNWRTDTRQVKGDVFILNLAHIGSADESLLSAVSRLCFYGEMGTLSEQSIPVVLNQLEPEFIPEMDSIQICELDLENSSKNLPSDEELEFFNGIGGFSKDNQRYVMYLEDHHNTPVPWSNVIANDTFGFITTESGGGFTWYQNSHENKLTDWGNDPVCDVPTEIFYLRDEQKRIWSLTANPIRLKSTYKVEYGFGYTTYKHMSHGLSQTLTQFVPLKGNEKISVICIENETKRPRRLALTYYIEPILGVNRSETAMHIVTEISPNGALTVKNGYNTPFSNQILFMESSIKERSYSGNRKSFLGKGGKRCPDELKKIQLSNVVGAGYDSCAAMQVPIELSEGERLELVFVMGVVEGEEALSQNTNRYTSADIAYEALEQVKSFWKDRLGVIQVSTPDTATNQMLNGHLLYQVIACRMWAKAAFYQAGGAYGFRDQLQDSLSLLMVWPEMSRSQILKHGAHQFREGDVLHWWHEPELKGVRTRISDDFLWLPFVVAQYISVTGDEEILKEEISFLESDPLKEFEYERYVMPTISSEKASLYEHCLRAIERSLHFGDHGLPLMGSGDWNDGMNRVGHEGKGESVWLAWFLLSIMKSWIPICLEQKDRSRAARYKEIYNTLVLSVENNAWDGNWYKRAFFDDGTPLGSAHNAECKIDSLAQTWSVLSEAGNFDRSFQSMLALEDNLINRNDGIIRLLAPPFNSSFCEPGYIKGYVPGVRENGGQYTHGATWVVAAFAKLGIGDKAFELFGMINPVNHTRTNLELGIYKLEPYVVAADVYGVRPHIGRGGWSWYTGAAGWMYQTGITSVLGISQSGPNLVIDPCIPQKWNQFSVKYIYEQTLYDIQVFNPDAVSHGILQITVNGVATTGNQIPLIGGQNVQRVEAVMGIH